VSTITSIAPWFGAKRTMAPRIVEVLGPHSAYWEPFCGSMAVLLAKAACKAEKVNDLHGDLINLARCIQHPMIGPALYRRLRRVWSSQELFRDSLATVRGERFDRADSPDIDRAFHYFITSWQGMNGVAGTNSFNTNYCRRFSTTGGDPGARWTGAVRSIPQWRRRLERVEVLQSDGIELCEKIEDRESVVVYVDPPYLTKGAKYLYDFADSDHNRLAKVLARFKRSRVVVSYYDDPRLEDLYPGWRKRSIDVAKNMVNSGQAGKDGRVNAPEVLLTNLPWYDQGRDEPPSLFGRTA
jgi:DNA adenine methylase